MKKNLPLLIFLIVSINCYSRFYTAPSKVSEIKPKLPEHPEKVDKMVGGPFNSSDKDIGDKILNLCPPPSQPVTIRAEVTPGADSYQWYKIVGTYDLFGGGNITWGAWIELNKENNNSFNVSNAVNPGQIVVFVCHKVEGKNTYSTTPVGYLISDGVLLNGYSAENGHVCPGHNAIINTDINVNAAEANYTWQEKPGFSSSWQVYENGGNDFPLSINASSYLLDGYDYRLKIANACFDTVLPTIRDEGVLISIANEESYEHPSDMNIYTCINSEVTTNLSLNNTNGFHTYMYRWEKQNAESSDWEIITGDAGGVFSSYNQLNLNITPNNEEFHNMKFRCTTYGACDTIVSNSFVLKLNVPAEITDIILDTDTVCQGGSFNCTAVIAGNPLATPVEYNWKINGNPVAGESFGTSDEYFTRSVNSESKTVTCQVRNADECSSVFYELTKTVKVYKDPEVSINVTGTGCSGLTATLTAEVTKGKSPYSYLWAFTALPGSSTSKTISDMPANAAYAVSVTDNCSNTDTSSAYVSSFPLLSLQYTKSNVLCFGQENGSINAVVSGGTTPYNIEIKRNDTVISSYSVNSGLINLTGLFAGEYKITVTDDCFTIVSETIEISQPNDLTAAISDYQNVSCRGLGDGYATVSVSGGTTPYTINWSNGQKNETALGLFADDYIANVIDDNGCFATRKISITEPDVFNVNYNVENVSCNGLNDGEINIFVSGGVEPYTASIIGSDSVYNSTSQTNLNPGNYTIVVSDSCGNTFSKNVEITEPSPLTYNAEISDVSCNGRSDGEISITSGGSVGAYSYNWADSSSSQTRTSLDAGSYYLTIYDSEECSDSLVTEIIVDEPNPLTSTINTENVTCYSIGDGSAEIIVSGGTEPYIYSWSNGQTNSEAIGLFAGFYSVNVIDANGCITNANVTINQLEALSSELNTNYTKCNTNIGSITAEISGGLEPYNLTWNNGQSGNEITQLSTGTYKLTVSDNLGCTHYDSAEVITDVDPIEICMVTVEPEITKNQIVWTKKSSSSIAGYNIFKLSYTGNFKLLAFIPYDSLSYCIDGTSNPQTTPGYYTISAVDKCGNESEMSDYHKTLHLNVSESSQADGYSLTWSHYEGFDFSTYIIYRGNSPDSLLPIDTISYNIGNYTYTDLNAPKTNFSYYQIGAVRSLGSCIATKASSGPFSHSISNIEDNRLRDDNIDYNSNIASVNAFPNPTNGEVNISYSLSSPEDAEISVVSLTGIVIYKKTIPAASQNAVRMEIKNPGIYMIRVKVKNSVVIKRIIVI